MEKGDSLKMALRHKGWDSNFAWMMDWGVICFATNDALQQKGLDSLSQPSELEVGHLG